MEKMPFRSEPGFEPLCPPAAPRVVTSDWQQGLPVLMGRTVTLRELQMSDAASLFTLLTSEEVSRFISPPPSSVEGFERFIAWAVKQREIGAYVCFAVTPADSDAAIGLFQIRASEPDFATAEWGFAIGSPFWGTGVFEEGAGLVVNFAFETIGVHRLEARAAVKNGRGNGALRKLGAVQEGVLRKAFFRNGQHYDQILWTIVDEDWQAKVIWGGGQVVLH
jgi:RimJ/RimL family protein N-acetyltransferase